LYVEGAVTDLDDTAEAAEAADSAAPSRRRRRAANRREFRLNLRLTADEAEVINTAARAYELTATGFATMAALAVARDQVAPLPMEAREQFQMLMNAQTRLRVLTTTLQQLTDTAEPGHDLSALTGHIASAIEQMETAAMAIASQRS
jgi:uncharacterized protein (DUF1778 family)